jgi:predicted permease
VAKLALSIGIGCVSAIFTAVDAVLLKPLPYSHGDRWVAVFGGSPLENERERYSAISYADAVDYQTRNHSFDVFGWYTIGGDYNLSSPGTPQHISGIELTPDLLNNLGVSPARGRLFQESDGSNAAVLSHKLWTSLGSNPALIGKRIILDGQGYTVTGVMPEWFRFPIVGVASDDTTNNAVWVPVKPPATEGARRLMSMYAAYGRLKPGVTVEEARADVKRVAASIARDDPANHEAYTAVVFGLRDFVGRQIRPILLLLFSAAGLLLLITCGNVAGLLLTRSVGRARETAIRIALGGGRRELALQFFFEGLLVALAAAALAVLASIALVKSILAIAAAYIPRADEVTTNWSVVLFAIGVACLAAILSSLAPLWQAVRTHPNEVLSDGLRASAGARSRNLSRSLVVLEVALAFTLLSVGALLVSQLERLNHTSPGFDADNLITFQLNVSDRQHAMGDRLPAYQNRLVEALKTIPGVRDVAVANQVPLAGCCLGSSLYPEGQPDRTGIDPSVSFLSVSPDYFHTLGIPLRRGRLLNEQDTDEKLIPIVIDESAARRFWPNGSALGATAHIGQTNGTRVQVIGVVRDIRNDGLGTATRPEVYLLNTLAPPNPMQFLLRSNLSQADLAPLIRRKLREIDPAQPIFGMQSLHEVIADSLGFQRLSSTIVSFFACAALLMASLGVFGVTAYSVRQRRVEIGTRMALGATTRHLLRLVVGSGVSMAVYGLAVGAVAVVLASIAVARYFDIHDVSPAPYLASVVIIGTVALLASFIPAWQATLLSPMLAIRDQSDSLWSVTRRGVEQALGVSLGFESSPASEAIVTSDLMEASRRAGSFSEVRHIALATVQEKLRAESVLLFEGLPGQPFRCVAAIPETPASAGSIPANGFLLARLRSYGSPLSFSPADLNTSLRWAAEQKPDQAEEITTLANMRLTLAAALRLRDEVLGVLLVGPPTGREEYSVAERGLLRRYAEQFSLMAENARLTERVVEQEKVRRDVALAAEVQQRLLPELPPQSTRSSLAAFTLPVRTVGGDYYDFLNTGEDRIGIALADVAGKGVAAALIMAVIHASLRIIASEKEIPLPELAARMNSFLHRSTGASSYATFFYAQLDERNRQLRYVNAGHNPPFLVRSGTGTEPAIEELATGGMIIGMFPFAAYEEACIDVKPGDVLLIFTDGVTEALNEEGEEFGEERLKALIGRLAPASVNEIKARIAEEIRTWIGSAAQHDDLTFVVMKVN